MVGDDNEVANISTIDTKYHNAIEQSSILHICIYSVRTLVPGKTHSFLYYASPPQLYTVKEAKVKWEHINSIDCFLFCDENIYVDEIKITPLILKRNVRQQIKLLKSPRFFTAMFQYFDVMSGQRENRHRKWELFNVRKMRFKCNLTDRQKRTDIRFDHTATV